MQTQSLDFKFEDCRNSSNSQKAKTSLVNSSKFIGIENYLPKKIPVIDNQRLIDNKDETIQQIYENQIKNLVKKQDTNFLNLNLDKLEDISSQLIKEFSEVLSEKDPREQEQNTSKTINIKNKHKTNNCFKNEKLVHDFCKNENLNDRQQVNNNNWSLMLKVEAILANF